MSHPLHSIEPPSSAQVQQHKGLVAAASKKKGWLLRWLERAADALERAEQRITASFRVPPGGG